MSLTVTANLIDLSGSANAGYAVFTLEGNKNLPMTTAGSPPGSIALTNFRVVANGSGFISQVIVGNDAVSPAGTWYRVDIFASTGAYVSTAKYYLTGSGTLSLNTLSPIKP